MFFIFITVDHVKIEKCFGNALLYYPTCSLAYYIESSLFGDIGKLRKYIPQVSLWDLTFSLGCHSKQSFSGLPLGVHVASLNPFTIKGSSKNKM